MASAKILIVEDEILIARRIESTLHSLGYEVTGIAPDADDAFQKVIEMEPNLILMDIVIQGDRDGVMAARHIYEHFQIPVVYLTAYADASILERAKATHPFGYVLKPFSQNDLRVAIELALFQHQTRSAALKAQKGSLLQAENLAMLSHELRTPLSVIKLSASLLEDYSHRINEQAQKQYFSRIQSAVETMDHLLEDVLTLEHTESNQVCFTPVWLDVVNFCQELIESLQWSAGTSYTLTFSSQSSHLLAYLDEKLLWHLLNNLLSNALKYSPQGGLVTLRLTHAANAVCFSVQDQGIGIPVDEQARLFTPFQRGSNVGQIPGTGLGLAIAKRAAELHKGDISVTSQVGKGTTFLVRLPLQQ